MRSLVIRAAFAMSVVVIMIVGTVVPLPVVRIAPPLFDALPWVLYGFWGVAVLIAMPIVLRNTRVPSQRVVLKMAFFESGAMYGMILRLLGEPIVHLYVFGGLALLLIIGSFFLSPGE